MQRPPLVVSGFGPFEDVPLNPSGQIALELPVRASWDAPVAGGVLPVSFRRAPVAFDRLLLSLPAPRGLLPIGVHPGEGFRVEERAGGRFEIHDRPDMDGGVAAEVGEAGEDRETVVDAEALAEVLREAGAPAVEVSRDAGGYVCERLYHHVLGLSAALGVPAVFLHVPPPEVLPVERQVELVAALVEHGLA